MSEPTREVSEQGPLRNDVSVCWQKCIIYGVNTQLPGALPRAPRGPVSSMAATYPREVDRLPCARGIVYGLFIVYGTGGSGERKWGGTQTDTN